MNPSLGLDHCLSFINCQLQPPPGKPRALDDGAERCAVTISRQTGSGGHEIAEKLAAKLQATVAECGCPWTVFDRNLIEKVFQDHNLPSRLAKFMPEDRVSELSDTMDELFGLHPPSWMLVRKISDTILHLAELGHVILIGRAANVITASLSHVLHVRLVGSVEKRLEYLRSHYGLSARDALHRLQTEDRGRARYVKKYFGRNIDDPLLYHLVINTDLLSREDAAESIVQLVRQRKGVAAA